MAVNAGRAVLRANGKLSRQRHVADEVEREQLTLQRLSERSDERCWVSVKPVVPLPFSGRLRDPSPSEIIPTERTGVSLFRDRILVFVGWFLPV